jgi:hypothetical protein
MMVCPHCGYCPHCGRSSQPVVQQPYYPQYIGVPTVGTPMWTTQAVALGGIAPAIGNTTSTHE